MDYNNCQYNDSISQLTHLNLYADRQQNYENSFNMLIKCNDEYLFEQLNGSSGKDSFLDLILIFARMSPMRKKLPNIFAQLNNQTDKRSASNVAHLWRGYDCDLNRLAMDRQKAMFADHTVVDVLVSAELFLHTAPDDFGKSGPNVLANHSISELLLKNPCIFLPFHSDMNIA